MLSEYKIPLLLPDGIASDDTKTGRVCNKARSFESTFSIKNPWTKWDEYDHRFKYLLCGMHPELIRSMAALAMETWEHQQLIHSKRFIQILQKKMAKFQESHGKYKAEALKNQNEINRLSLRAENLKAVGTKYKAQCAKLKSAFLRTKENANKLRNDLNQKERRIHHIETKYNELAQSQNIPSSHHSGHSGNGQSRDTQSMPYRRHQRTPNPISTSYHPYSMEMQHQYASQPLPALESSPNHRRRRHSNSSSNPVEIVFDIHCLLFLCVFEGITECPEEKEPDGDEWNH